MRDYELVILLHPDLEIDLDTPLKKVANVITRDGGKIIKQDIWGKRRLAYPIRKEEFAVYVYFEIQLAPESVSKVESVYNITDEVLRYIITQPVPKVEEKDEDKDADNDKKDKKDGKKEPKAEIKETKTPKETKKESKE